MGLFILNYRSITSQKSGGWLRTHNYFWRGCCSSPGVRIKDTEKDQKSIFRSLLLWIVVMEFTDSHQWSLHSKNAYHHPIVRLERRVILRCRYESAILSAFSQIKSFEEVIFFWNIWICSSAHTSQMGMDMLMPLTKCISILNKKYHWYYLKSHFFSRAFHFNFLLKIGI